MEARRPMALEAALFVLIVALPLAFFPQSRDAFLDVKILLLAGGTLLMWVAGLPIDRRIALPALVWAAVVVLAAVAGVDPVESLIGTVRGSASCCSCARRPWSRWHRACPRACSTAPAAGSCGPG